MVDMKTMVFVIMMVLFTVNMAFGIPTLQLYIPDANYNENTESWLACNNPFELWVVGADQPNQVDYIKDVKLHFAIPMEYYVPDGNIHIWGEGIDKWIDSFTLGQPAEIQQPHGIYPAYYYTLDLPDLEVDTAGETVYNYNPGEDGQDTGDIQKFYVEYTNYFLIHMDLTGVAVWENGRLKNVFAPYSHDADAPSIVSEPSTFILIGGGIIILMVYRRRFYRTERIMRNRIIL